MKYALFAMGLLLLLIGGLCIIVGATYLDVDRGSASIIAGTIAFVGGLLSASLAWVIKSLEDLCATIASRPTAPAGRAATATGYGREDFAEAPELPVPHMTWPPHTTPAHVPEPSGLDQIQAYAEPEPPAEPLEPSLYAGREREDEPAARVKELRPTPPPASKPSPSVKTLWRRTEKEAQTIIASKQFAKEPPVKPSPISGAVPPAPPAMPAAKPPLEEPTETAPAMDETTVWFERAFADLGEGLAETQVPTHASETAAQEERHAEEREAARETHEPQPDLAFEAAPPPLSPEPGQDHLPGEGAEAPPTIIGRYEAEGTSYIMFADGSIEAQSERGVARFKSMADLKAYFESQDAP